MLQLPIFWVLGPHGKSVAGNLFSVFLSLPYDLFLLLLVLLKLPPTGRFSFSHCLQK
jgi:hypothetical protein